MSTEKTTRKPSIEVRQRLIDESEKVVEECGLSEFTVRNVAARAHVSVASIYNHFGDKEGLLAEVAGRHFECLADLFSTFDNLRGSVRASTLLVQIATAYHKFALDKPELYKLLFSRDFGSNLNAVRAFEVLKSVIEDGQESGEFSPEIDADQASHFIWSACHGRILLILGGVNNEWVGDMPPNVLVNFIIRGIHT